MNDAAAVQALRDAVTEPQHIEFDQDHGVIVAPEGYQVIDAKPFMPPPRRIQAAVKLDTIEAFALYALQFAPASTVFANEAVLTWLAYLDYHKPGERNDCGHTATLALKYSFEGALWLGNHGKRMTHDEFVRFLEDRAKEISSLPTAQLYEIVRSLSIKSDASFSSEISLHDNAVRLSYEEQIRGAAKPGAVDLPREFVVTLPLFDGMPDRGLLARLRFQVKDAKLLLWYEFADKDRHLKEAVEAVTAALKVQLPDAKFYSGIASRV